MSLRARKGYLTAFRQSIERRDVVAGRCALERRRSLDDRNAGAGARRSPIPRAWSTPSTCSSRSTSATSSRRCCSTTSRRRCARRALRAIGAVRSDIATQMAAAGPADARRSGRRACARRRSSRIGAINNEDAATLSRPLLADPDPRIRVTAAVALAGQQRAGTTSTPPKRRWSSSPATRQRPGARRRAATSPRRCATSPTRASAGC